MNACECLSFLEAYYELGSLKFKEIRKRDEVQASNRNESIADTVYGAQQWAWLLWSECIRSIDILKVVSMISLSEIYRVNRSAIMLVGDYQKQRRMRLLINEFEERKTPESNVAHLCKSLNDKNYDIEDIITKMTDEQIKNLLYVHDTLELLKTKIRQGIINWNITGIRRESVSEHVYSAQQLAWLMWLVAEEEIDILKVIGMLSIHETEETIIGDITPYSGITPEEKLQMGHDAVKKLLGKLKEFNVMYSFIEEFDEEKTCNAFFAHLCDKLDCDLAVKYYSDGGYCSIENATDDMKNNPKIQKLIDSGAKTVADAFIMADECMYTGTIFEEIIDAVKTCDTSSY